MKAEDEILANMQHKTIVMTGATSGLGRVAALKLAEAGARVWVMCRNPLKGEELLKDFAYAENESAGSIKLVSCDLTDLKTVVSACAHIMADSPQIDALLNNAGVWIFKRRETADGIETTFQVNVLAPLLIARLLMPALRAAAGARVVNTASAMHKGPIYWDDVELRAGYTGFKAYQQSKLALILLTRLYAARHAAEGIAHYSVHPGLVSTDIGREGGWLARAFFSVFGISPEEGADTLLYLTNTDPALLENGSYYIKRRPVGSATPLSRDLDAAARLEALCLEYLRTWIQ
ncbi:MAG: SDR family NAD(P)-dependent oxidoreductase [Saprospiraceae bacterium]